MMSDMIDWRSENLKQKHIESVIIKEKYITFPANHSPGYTLGDLQSFVHQNCKAAEIKTDQYRLSGLGDKDQWYRVLFCSVSCVLWVALLESIPESKLVD